MSKWIEQLNRCCGLFPKPYVKPRPKSGIDKELELWRKKKLDAIEDEYEQEFGGER